MLVHWPGSPGNCLRRFAEQIQNTDVTDFSERAEGERSYGGKGSLMQGVLSVLIPQGELKMLMRGYSRLRVRAVR